MGFICWRSWPFRNVLVCGLVAALLGTGLYRANARPPEPRRLGAERSGAVPGEADPDESESSSEEDAPVERVGIVESGYIEAMEEFLETSAKTRTERNATVKVSANPAVYEYRMALILADLEEQGLTGRRLERELRSRARRAELVSKYKGNVGFHVQVEASPKTMKLVARDGEEVEHTFQTYLVLTKQRLQDHVTLEQGHEKSCSVRSDAGTRIKLYRWQVFQGRMAGVVYLPLHATQKMEFDVISSAVDVDDREPVQLGLKKVLIQSEGLHSDDSINEKLRQISSRRLSELEAKELDVKFRPAFDWAKMPKPPESFARLLEKVER